MKQKLKKRKFIRHPLGCPIKHHFINSDEPQREAYALNVSEGGLCFHSRTYIAPDQLIQIDIPIGDTLFQSVCLVSWCTVEDGHFDVGVKFENKDTEFTVRLVEQACHIEEYRKKILADEGRELSEEDAAREWVEKHANSFPK